MKINKKIPVFGDISCREKCSVEDTEHINFVSWLRLNYPSHAKLIIHPKNEGKRSFSQANKEKKLGLTKGASDIIILAKVPFVCEIKRADHTKSRWQQGQEDFLLSSLDAGCFSCVALGAEGAKEAFINWLETTS